MSSRQLRQAFLVIVAMLLGIGIVSVYSSSALISEATYGHSLNFLRHHVLAVILGIALGVGCLALPYDGLRRSTRWILLGSMILLILVLIVGPEVGGAKRWIRLGRWSFQPSEFAQLALILYLADLLARKAACLQEFRRGLLPALVATCVVAGMVAIQPDFGTAVTISFVAFLLLVVAKARWVHLFRVMVLAAIVFAVLVAGEEYRWQRILTFLNPQQDPAGSGYQILQSYVAMASGGFAGVGIGGSLQKLFYLPSAHTDFIFAIIGEELGLIGTTALVSLFALLMICGLRLAMATRDLFSKYLVCGLVGMLSLDAMINIGAVTGMLPTKGLPLPLVSYGGSSMVINLLACALIVKASHDGERDIVESPARC